jgi:hypothetical protein
MFARIGLGIAALATALAMTTATATAASPKPRVSFSLSFGSPFFYSAPRTYAYAPYYYAPTYAPTVNYGYSAHVAYCQMRYRSYNLATDLFLGYDGHYHYCVSPY